MAKKTVDDIQVKGKRVLVRCDFNVPMKDGKITNDKRIVAALPTIKKLIADGGKVILCSHLGKPKNGPEEKFSLAPVAVRLSELLGQNVVFANDDNVVGENAKAAVAAMKDGDVVLLQNTRFRAEETKNGEAFSKDLATLADAYVDDAFGSCHRAHCSTAGVTAYTSPNVAGYLIGKELSIMGKALENADRPFVAVLGGAKIEDKLNVINNLLEKVDTLIIGGGMAFTFLKAKGYEVGKSLLDESKIDYCKDMMAKAAEKGVKLLLPIDTVCAAGFPDPIDGPVDVCVVDSDKIPADVEGLDIGPKTRELFAEAVKTAKTVVWNGPMGVFENPTLAQGTLAVAQAMADSDAVTIIGGGDSAAAVEQMGLGAKMTHISTGGGASLEFLEGKTLPGVACLDEK
ncbi:phosphoglycerate kinase [Aristaeella hokkaidonensis]|uniref:Phosphoglycerate kinase n=1 Tax=Aristaeella hokkaidonensis TaxID=3046382 RepID=A0AC61MYM1_9FIRM|nr:phosphoglycerate kinase [Aristaeella hokkaidonensis]MBQ6289819.1 phosphoglycerate kinase [Clostridia bacterium]QUC68232.1 phosphoglycerate kinase [Aristaeella hokkaidonensis]SNT95330.1 phosphoglycerate kinase [Aristaeella hokkaidonensis]